MRSLGSSPRRGLKVASDGVGIGLIDRRVDEESLRLSYFSQLPSWMQQTCDLIARLLTVRGHIWPELARTGNQVSVCFRYRMSHLRGAEGGVDVLILQHIWGPNCTALVCSLRAPRGWMAFCGWVFPATRQRLLKVQGGLYYTVNLTN